VGVKLVHPIGRQRLRDLRGDVFKIFGHERVSVIRGEVVAVLNQAQMYQLISNFVIRWR
jgi:hypothetical protein